MKRTVRRVVSLVLLLVLMVSNIVNVSALSGANKRVSSFIQLGAGKQVTSGDLESMNLTTRDLRFLGIYLSNFYVPFATEFGQNVTSDTTKKTKENIIKALQTNLSFSDSLADSLTESIIGLSRSNIKELKIYISKEYQDGKYEEVDLSANLRTVLELMVGDTTSYGKLGNLSSKLKVLDGFKYGYFGFKDGSEVKPVFDFSIEPQQVTPSMIALMSILESSDTSKGIGLSLFDFNFNNESDKAIVDTIKEDINNSNAYKLSMLGTRLAVDCFGNILLLGSNHQYVMVPSCMNPYTWIEVNQDGTDLGSAGSFTNIINIPTLTKIDNGTYFKNELNTSNITMNSSGVVDYVLPLDSFISDLPGRDIHSNSLSPEDSLDVKFNYMREVIEILYKYSGADVSVVKDGNNVRLIGNISSISKLDLTKFNSVLNVKKINEIEVNIIKVGDKEYVVNKNFIVLLTNIYNFSKDVLDGKSDKNSNSLSPNTTSTRLRSMIYNDNNFLKKFASKEGFEIKPARGNDKKSLLSIFGISDMEKFTSELYAKCISGFISVYPNDIPYTQKELERLFVKTSRSGTQCTPNNTATNYVDSFVLIDDLGTFKFNSSEESQDYSSLKVENYIDSSGNSLDLLGAWKTDSKNGFGSLFSDISSGDMVIPENIKGEFLVGLYLTYAYACLYDSESTDGGILSKSETIGEIGYRVNDTGLPSITESPLKLSAEVQSDQMLTDIRDYMYYILNPTDKTGIAYFTELVRNKSNGLTVDLHERMVGSKDVGNVMGTTKYRGNSSYITTPELKDVDWVNSLLEFYVSAIPFLVILMVILMVLAVITGMTTIQKGIISVIVFSVSLFLPMLIVNKTVSTSNKAITKMYDKKFNYWGLAQHQTYIDEIDKSASGDDYTNYLKTLYSTNQEKNPNQGGESIILKWQAPKKMSSLMFSSEEKKTLGASGALLSGVIRKTYSGEKYTENKESVYLYRSYIDIANFSRYIYQSIKDKKQPIASTITNDMTKTLQKGFQTKLSTIDVDYEKDRTAGYTPESLSGSSNLQSSLRLRAPLSGTIYTDALGKKNTVTGLSATEYVGLNQDYFNFSLPMFNKGLNFKDTLIATSNSGKDVLKDDIESNSYTSEDLTSLASYGLMSENVFYYFSWYLYDMGLSTDSTVNTGFKNLVLGGNDGKFFYNTESNSELRDFMDFKSLFTYVIPYLKEGNSLVKEWEDVYGTEINKGVPTEEGHSQDTDISASKELTQKYWHNLNVARLYNMYTPWVDLMYDCDYSRPVTISYMGKKAMITDPLNPETYPEDRPMVFSRSEMFDLGLTEDKLTEVEKKILKCQEQMQKLMISLLNYNSFSDPVLNTSCAMSSAFIFNNEFSKTSLFKEDINIYPQTYELSDFSYDAYLRFILASSTNTDITKTTSDFYTTVINTSDFTTSIVMIILDFLSIYIVPWLKIFFIIGICFLSIVSLLVATLKLKPDEKYFRKLVDVLLNPAFKYFTISTLFAFIVSLFMGEGSSSVTGTSSKFLINLGSPTTTMIAMIILNVISVIAYVSILKKLVKDLKSNSKIFAGFVKGVVGSVGVATASAIGAGSFAKSSIKNVKRTTLNVAGVPGKLLRKKDYSIKRSINKTIYKRQKESIKAKKVKSATDNKKRDEINKKTKGKE